MEYREFSYFTFDSATDYQVINGTEEKVSRATLLGNNKIKFEVFDHTEPNEKYRKLGMRVIPATQVHSVSSELYSKWEAYLKDCAKHGEYKPNGDRRNLHDY